MTATETKPAPLKLRDDLVTELRRAFHTCPVVATDFDVNLLTLGDSLGALARSISHPSNIKHRLLSMAAFAMQWSCTGNFEIALRAVQRERARQKQLFSAGKLSFDCASPVVDERRKFRVLFEELGEVAQDVDRIEQHPGNVSYYVALTEELIQVAAVAFAWLEALEAQG